MCFCLNVWKTYFFHSKSFGIAPEWVRFQSRATASQRLNDAKSALFAIGLYQKTSGCFTIGEEVLVLVQHSDSALISCTGLFGVGGIHVSILNRLDGQKGPFINVTWTLYYLESSIMIHWPWAVLVSLFMCSGPIDWVEFWWRPWVHQQCSTRERNSFSEENGVSPMSMLCSSGLYTP